MKAVGVAKVRKDRQERDGGKERDGGRTRNEFIDRRLFPALCELERVST